ncbi:MAG: dihydrofolate reductase [Clostridiaceae bacterium]|jgi:dihydrofolate reductase|nr:dihydrofolate reductase [Clostridiaceae bacterium]
MKAIVACDAKWGIGYEGQLQQRVSADLRRFRAMTTGKVVIYGRKTLDTFPKNKPLPQRVNLIFHRRIEPPIEGAHFLCNLEDLWSALSALRKKGYQEDDFIVIGGESIYELLFPWIDEVHLTQFKEAYPADVYFPRLDRMPDWTMTSCGEWLEEDGVSFRYLTFQRQSIA